MQWIRIRNAAFKHLTSAPREAWESELEIMKDRRIDQRTDRDIGKFHIQLINKRQYTYLLNQTQNVTPRTLCVHTVTRAEIILERILKHFDIPDLI